jgi:hypothetical protein
MVEQLTLNQLVEGSSPSRGTIFSASVAELVDAAGSKLHLGVYSCFIIPLFPRKNRFAHPRLSRQK